MGAYDDAYTAFSEGKCEEAASLIMREVRLGNEPEIEDFIGRAPFVRFITDVVSREMKNPLDIPSWVHGLANVYYDDIRLRAMLSAAGITFVGEGKDDMSYLTYLLLECGATEALLYAGVLSATGKDGARVAYDFVTRFFFGDIVGDDRWKMDSASNATNNPSLNRAAMGYIENKIVYFILWRADAYGVARVEDEHIFEIYGIKPFFPGEDDEIPF